MILGCYYDFDKILQFETQKTYRQSDCQTDKQTNTQRETYSRQ